MRSPVMISLKSKRHHSRAFILCLTTMLCLSLMSSGPAWAGVGANPPAGNPDDYGGGDWLGTAAFDNYTNNGTVSGNVSLDAGNDVFTNNGQVTGTVNGGNWHDQLTNNATGQIDVTLQGGNGNDTLINHGTVGVNLWGGNHNDTIENHGTAYRILGGTGDDNITNTGTVTNINGEDGNDTIVNSGTVAQIRGADGVDHITNNGTVSQYILPGHGDDTIINNDTVTQHIYGDLGNDTVTNNGNVAGWITTNEDDDTITNNGSVGLGISGGEGDDTITNNGSVGTSIQGHEGDDTITVNGRVDGDIACDQDDDWVILKSGASVGGSIRGGVGTNTVTYDNVPDTGAFTLTNFTQVEYIGDNGMSGSQDVSGIVMAVRGTLRMQNGTLNPSLMQVAGGTLAGNGQITSDVVVSLAGSVAPGNSIGTISVNSVNLPGGTNYNVELSGASADRLIVATDVVISGPNLNLTLLGAPYINSKYTIIRKDGAGAVNGAFNGLAEGDTFTAGGNDFTISYVGGDGNDVVLTALTGSNPPAPSPEPEPKPGVDPPAAPQVSQDLSPNPTGSMNGPVISWPKVGGTNHYNIYRAACPTCPKTKVGRVPGTSFTDETALPGQVYYYFIRSDNGALSDYSDWIPAWRYEQNPGRDGDYNGDGIMDLLWWEPGSGQLKIWFMNGGSVQSVSAPVEGLDISQWLLVNTGDFNNDGIWDLLWWNPETGEAAIRYMAAQSAVSNGFSPSSTTAGDITGNVTLSYPGDLNGDGRADLIWRDYATGFVTIWLMGEDGKPALNGPPTLADGMTDGGKPGVVDSLEWTMRGLFDMNADGKSDVIWQHGWDGRVVVWYMDGSQATGVSQYQRIEPENWRVAGLGDLNGDGLGDIVWRNDSTGAVQAWLMTGADPAYEQRDIAMGDEAALWQVKAVGDFCTPGCDDVYCKNADTGAARIITLDGREFYPSVE
jgi:Ca2+-binding RTX toxin-like protein